MTELIGGVAMNRANADCHQEKVRNISQRMD
jgi:hypothetical protein